METVRYLGLFNLGNYFYMCELGIWAYLT